MILYEKHRSDVKDHVYHQDDVNLNFGLHLHNSYEFIYCFSGEIGLTVENESFVLKAGEAALVLPNQIHAYRTAEFSKTYLCVFSTSYLFAFSESAKDKKAKNPVFPFKGYEYIFDRLKDPKANKYLLKSCFYLILGVCADHAVFIPKDMKLSTLMNKIVEYVSQNYDKDISLEGLAADLNYNYYYLSGFVNKTIGINFSRLVNEYRISAAQNMLSNTDMLITDIASACGYDSIRSFNRNFLNITGKTPEDYKKSS